MLWIGQFRRVAVRIELHAALAGAVLPTTLTGRLNMAFGISNRARKLGLLCGIVLAGLYLAACLN